MEKCPNCEGEKGPDDLFCESCGYDYVTGSLPEQEADSEGKTEAISGNSAGEDDNSNQDESDNDEAEAETNEDSTEADQPEEEVAEVSLGEPKEFVVEVGVSRSFFDEVVGEAEVEFPDPEPKSAKIEYTTAELHIGRTSESRDIHPDLDVSELTGDRAVSSSHAVIRVDPDGGLTITDLGSVNGTFMELDQDPIAHGEVATVEIGKPIYVGAWTCLTVLETKK